MRSPGLLFTATADSKHGKCSKVGSDHIHGVFTLAPRRWAAIMMIHFVWEIPYRLKNGVVTVDSLYAYVKEHQKLPLRTTIYRPASRYQHPMTNGGAMDFILFTL